VDHSKEAISIGGEIEIVIAHNSCDVGFPIAGRSLLRCPIGMEILDWLCEYQKYGPWPSPEA